MGPHLDDDLEQRLVELSRVPQLLVACDYDGTVAPLVDDPRRAHPRRETIAAIRELAGLAQTHVAVVSGRSLRDLAVLSRLPDEVHLVGSHGSELDVDFADTLDADLRALRDLIGQEARRIAGATPGAMVEQKPAGVAVHLRNVADPAAAEALAARLADGPGRFPGTHLRRLSNVVELAVLETDKGRALDGLRRRVGASAVLFLGDDLTDEDAFATLTGPDVGVKVGPGETGATHRVHDPVDVARVLAQLARLRGEWLTGAGIVALEEHSVLSDQRTLAVVTPDARITWLCLPRVDSAAVFAELVGGPAAGYFAVCPIDGGPPTRQRYLGASMVLETTFPTFTVTDYLDTSGGRAGEVAGRSDLIRVLEGNGSVRVEFAPRLDFGRVATGLEVRGDGLVAVGTNEQLVLRSPGVTWWVEDDGLHQKAVAEVDLTSRTVVLELRGGTDLLDADARPEPVRRRETHAHWSDWAEGLRLPDTEPELVRRSALLLRALCHGPTGAIVAAGTTSLPEHLGGVRNWDYRYCWLRDAALAARALVGLASTAEALAYLAWLGGVVEQRGAPERLSPLYLVSGRHLPPEAELSDLAGYAGSRPVRIGNAAEGQVQLDQFGPIVDLVWVLAESGAAVGPEQRALVAAMVDAVAVRWPEPDHGIWEERTRTRHHTSSKVMCWLAVDRAIRLERKLAGSAPETWSLLEEAISADVLTRGWNDAAGAFTAVYDDADELDGSVLALGRYGLLDPGDDRFVATVAAVERSLLEGTTVLRYRHDDGLPGREGGFHLMTSWLIDGLALVGRIDDARALFASLCAAAGPTGVVTEEVDPDSGRSLGNLPQAYSHLGLIENALLLDRLGSPLSD